MQTFFFDLDNTLYPHSAGVTEALEEKMNAYVAEITQLDTLDAAKVRQGYFERYGTTLRGLQLHHAVDTEAYLAQVHDIHIEALVTHNQPLCDLLQPILHQSRVFTNSPREHAVRVLAALGFRDNQWTIIDIRATDFQPKPQIAAYEVALRCAQAVPASSVLFEDTLANLKTAKEIGMRTVYMQAPDREIHVPNYVDAAYNDIVTAIQVECTEK
jgi:putative hydrolase of the HAD superfamily